MSNSFRSNWLATTALTAGFLAIAMTGALAQDKPDSADDSVETVTVTGFRGSLLKAIDLKHDAVGSQDSIVADDIAAFPDLNLAEALQRIPGIAITRDSGEGRQIVLRGLGPDFTRTQVNGMEVLSNTASGMDNRGGVSRTRSFDFSLFASELFDKVTVQKSYAADQDEGGIAGTVQLDTAKPFDYDGFKAVGSLKGVTNSNTSGVTPRAVGLISDRWGDFGALVSVAYSTNDSNEYGYRNWGWGQINVKPANVGPGVSAADAARLESASTTNQLFAPQADTYSTWFDHRERLGVTSSLQYQPSDRLSVSLDMLYGRLTDHRNDYSLADAGTNGLTGNISGTQLINSVVVQGNTLVAANISHVDLRSEFNVEEDSTKFYQAELNGSYRVFDNLTATALVGYSRSEYALPVFDKVFLEAQNHTVGFDDTDPNHIVNTYDFNVADPTQWNLMRMDTQENGITSDYVNGKLDFAWVLNGASTVTFGGAYKKFMNDGFTRTDKEFHNQAGDLPIPAGDKDIVPYDTTLKYVVGDVDKTYAYIGQNRNLTVANDVPGSDFQVAEKTFAGYVQYNVNTTVFGYGLRANAGVRYFSTDLTSAGMLNTGSALVPVSIVHHYNDFLPAANVAVDFSDEFVGRFSINRNISRPALSDLAAAGTLTTRPTGGSISAGNPNLKPFMADSIEASLDYFEGHSGYASVGVFYKNMESFITTTTKQVPYNTTGYSPTFLLPGEDPSTLFDYSAPINGKGAVIAGVEFAVQKDFDFLPAPFDHFGVQGNLTYVDANTGVVFSGTTISLPLMNLSKLATNLTLYYETDLWGVRVSDAYRSKYLDGAGGGGNIGDAIRPTNNLDFAAHYNVDEHLKIVVEGINLTDTPIKQYEDLAANRPEVDTTSGRTITFGATYEF